MYRMLSLAILSATALTAADTIINDKAKLGSTAHSAPTEAIAAWRAQRMGLFIHWDPGSQHSIETSWGGKKHDPQWYDDLYKTFNPTQYNPQDWVSLAHAGGARYMVITAKHHAGFSMFDSAATDYDMMSTPYGKDPLKQLADACAEHDDMKFGFYYSPRDWRHPACATAEHNPVYNDYYMQQMTELLSNYGPINSIWFDGTGGGDWADTPERVARMIREKHPLAMVNDRGGYQGDFFTSEHSIGPRNTTEPWEACHTTSYGTWGYIAKAKSKPFPFLLKLATYTWGRDGNFLLNLGPSGEGIFTDEDYASWQALATWMETHSEAVHGTRAGPFIDGPWGTSTARDNTAYLYIYDWERTGGRQFPQLAGKTVTSARALNGQAITLSQNDTHFTIPQPENSTAGLPTVIAVEFSDTVVGTEPVIVQQPLGITSIVASNGDDLSALIDGDPYTAWSGQLSPETPTITFDITFTEATELHSYISERGHSWTPRAAWSLSIPDGNDGWTELPSTRFDVPNKSGSKWSASRSHPLRPLVESVHTQHIRFTLTAKGKEKMTFNELSFFAED